MAANNVWLARQIQQAQVGTVAITAVAGTPSQTNFTLQIPDASGPIVSVPGNAAGVNATATDLAAAATNATGPFDRITFAAANNIVTATALVAGEPFTLFSNTSGNANGTIGAYTAVTPNKSPNDANDVVNWSNAAPPVVGDTVYLDNVYGDLLYNLGNDTAAPAALYISGTFTNSVGLPKVNVQGNYWEYRARYWTVTPGNTFVGAISGSGPNLFMLNTAANQCNMTVFNTGSNPEPGIPSVLWIGTNALNTLTMYGGTAGFAFFAGEAGNLATVNLIGGNLIVGSGGNIATATVNGALDFNSAITNLTIDGSGAVTYRSGNATNVTVNGGTLTMLNPGNVVFTLLIMANGTIDATNASGTITCTNATLDGGWTIIDPLNRVVLTNPAVCPSGPNSGQILRSSANGTLKVT